MGRGNCLGANLGLMGTLGLCFRLLPRLITWTFLLYRSVTRDETLCLGVGLYSLTAFLLSTWL